ncbi:MAG: carbohydrate-binding protein [Acidobacteria bacterium]|nr:carbohydrate-binding protein [Acidobacteriota bacterium]
MWRSTRVRAVLAGIVLACSLFAAGSPVATQSPTGTWTAIDLGTLGGATASANGVGDLGEFAAGSSVTASGARHAFVWRALNGMRDLGTLGGRESEAVFVTTGWRIVGRAQVASGRFHAFAAEFNRPLTDLGTLGGSESAAYGANDWGAVVGSSKTAGDAHTSAFVYQDGAMTALDLPWSDDHAALAINDEGQIVGYVDTADRGRQAFLYEDGAATLLAQALGSSSVATAINRAGQIVGFFTNGDTSGGAFIHTAGVSAVLPGLGGAFAFARAINDEGDIVGEADTSSGARHAVLWRDRVATDLNSLLAPGSPWVLHAATGIDQYGNIVGNATLDGEPRAFLLVPPIDIAISLSRHENEIDTNIPRPHEAGRLLTLGVSVYHDQPHPLTGVVISDELSGPVEYVDWDTTEWDCTRSGQRLTCRLRQTISPGGRGRDLMLTVRATAAGEITHRATVRADAFDPDLSDNSAVETNVAVSLASLTLNSPIVGGKPSLARATITTGNVPGGARVTLASSNPAIATVPSAFDVLEGTWREFYVTTQPVSQVTTVLISATYGLVTITQPLTIIPVGGSVAFGGAPRTIPAIIQAEDFDDGGEGGAYHDTTTGNSGGAYRTTGVDIEKTADAAGGYNVGWIAAGEWLKYSVNAASAGTYRFDARVASPGVGGTFHLEANGVDVTGPMTIPDTGGWQSWRTVSANVVLAAGPQVLRVVFDRNGASGAAGNLNFIRLVLLSASTPYGGSARAVPGVVQAEDFDEGGEGVAYHDGSAGNSGGAYRATGVDLQRTTDSGGGYNVGWMAAGEWLQYTVKAEAAATYTLRARVAADGPGGTFHVEAGGVDVSGPIAIPDAGGWQIWTTVEARVRLRAGVQVLRLVLDANGPTGVFGNVNYLEVVR